LRGTIAPYPAELSLTSIVAGPSAGYADLPSTAIHDKNAATIAKPRPGKSCITHWLVPPPMPKHRSKEVGHDPSIFPPLTTKKVFLDHHGAVVNDLAEARDHATRLVQSFINEHSLEDWRDWVLHVSDDQGDELFVVPFIFVLGKSH
jgi:Domain of unknown function (DUF6894)